EPIHPCWKRSASYRPIPRRDAHGRTDRPSDAPDERPTAVLRASSAASWLRASPLRRALLMSATPPGDMALCHSGATETTSSVHQHPPRSAPDQAADLHHRPRSTAMTREPTRLQFPSAEGVSIAA